MRHVGAAIAGLAVASALTAVLFGAELVHANKTMRTQMSECESALNGGGGICSGYAQFGGREVPIAFTLAFVAGYLWHLRRTRSPRD